MSILRVLWSGCRNITAAFMCSVRLLLLLCSGLRLSSVASRVVMVVLRLCCAGVVIGRVRVSLVLGLVVGLIGAGARTLVSRLGVSSVGRRILNLLCSVVVVDVVSLVGLLRALASD